VFKSLFVAAECTDGGGRVTAIETARTPNTPRPTDGVSISAQQSFIVPLPLASGQTQWMWGGDRWQSAADNFKSHDFMAWVPLEFTADGSDVVPLTHVHPDFRQPWQLDLHVHNSSGATLPKASAEPRARSPKPPATAGLAFSGVFADNMVLQRAGGSTKWAAVYGLCSVVGRGMGGCQQQTCVCTFEPGATVTVTLASEGSMGAPIPPVTVPIAQDGTWKALLPAQPAGGNWTVTASCKLCSSGVGPDGGSTVVLRNVAFGDVFFCSGQSNMELALSFTFSRNASIAALRAGNYSNIRMTQARTAQSAYPLYVVNTSEWGNDRQPPGAPVFEWASAATLAQTPFLTKHNGCCGYDWAFNATVLEQFSATCYYFAQALTDLQGDAVPIGLISSSVGGTIIEAWTDNATLAQCPVEGRDISAGNQQLFNAMVLPYVNMTVKGWLWYQGENNVGEAPYIQPPKNASKGTVGRLIPIPYECMQPGLVASWRRAWSAVPGTTDPLGIFGIVGLAAGTSEGHGFNMPYFRHAQTAGYGVVPNPAMPNVVLANGYDVGDPWASDCAGRQANQSSCCRATWFSPIDPKRCHVAESEAGAPWNWDDTNYFMGPIHPRPKMWIGRRLAAAVHAVAYGGGGPASGPTLAACSVSPDGGSIVVTFNTSLLRGDVVVVERYNLTAVASAMEVQTSRNMTAPGPDGVWVAAHVELSGTNTVIVNISALKANKTAPLGVRYAWQDVPCCGGIDGFEVGDAPCPMASCPLKGSPSRLPAMPFMASIVDGKCACTSPQIC